MNTIFQVGPTVRRPGEGDPDRLFVGEMDPHNHERPWLAIRGTPSGTVVVTPGPRVTISLERP